MYSPNYIKIYNYNRYYQSANILRFELRSHMTGVEVSRVDTNRKKIVIYTKHFVVLI